MRYTVLRPVLSAVIVMALFAFQDDVAFGEDLGVIPENATARTLDGKEASLASHRGKLVFLVVWRTDCLGCLVEIPILNRLQKEYASEDFTVIGLSMDREQNRYVGNFIKKHKIAYPVWLGYGQPLSEYLNTHIIPTLIAIGPDGEVLGHAVGAIPSYGHAVDAIKQARDMIAARARGK